MSHRNSDERVRKKDHLFIFFIFFIIPAIVTTTHRIKPLQGNFLEISILKKYNTDSMKIITIPAIIICLTDRFISYE